MATGSQQRRLQPLLTPFPITHRLTEQSEEPRTVITVFAVAEFVSHHILDAGPRGTYQADVQGHRPGAREAAPAGLHGAHDQTPDAQAPWLPILGRGLCELSRCGARSANSMYAPPWARSRAAIFWPSFKSVGLIF